MSRTMQQEQEWRDEGAAGGDRVGGGQGQPVSRRATTSWPSAWAAPPCWPRRCATRWPRSLPVVVVTTEAFADVARRSVAARDVVVLPEVGTPGHDGLGMGYSIATGVSARPDAARLAGAARRHADGAQRARCSRWRASSPSHAVVYAQHKGVRGHPVGFSAELYSELIALRGDEGARRLVARYPAHRRRGRRPRRADRRRHRGRPGERAPGAAARRRRCRSACDAAARSARASAPARSSRSISRSRMPQRRSDAAVSSR